jgi:hypothetical protein
LVATTECAEAKAYPEKTGKGWRIPKMSKRSVTLLIKEMDDAWNALCSWVDGLTDPEFFWEPVPGCWTVHAGENGRWIVDYESSPPDPLPFTTIAWKLYHLASCKIMYHEYAFGDGKLRWEDLQVANAATEAISQLTESQAVLRTSLNDLHDDELEKSSLTNWGERWPTWKIIWTMITHDLHHGAEIGCLRELYRATSGSAEFTR